MLLNAVLEEKAPETGFLQEAQSVKEYVENYFSDIPVMIDIADCESRFRHFNRKGSVLRGEFTPLDVGVMQISEFYHKDTAAQLGLNLHSVEGNLAYARYLFEKEGTTPWLSSRKCWGRENHIARK